MSEATIRALMAYLQALKTEGITHVHCGMVIPNHTLTRFELHDAGKSWTQFPTIAPELLPEGIYWHQHSGWFFFDKSMYDRVAAA